MSDLMKAALDYAEQGWNVFPVQPNKKPYTKHGYLDGTRNVQQIEEWWNTWPDANIGFSPGDAELLVFDIDPGATIDTLNKALDGSLPDTQLAARTPRGGHHLYFKLNGGETVRPSASQVAKHIDVRSSGSYVLLPPSRTSEGEYKWLGEHGSRAKVARRTDAMISVVGRKRERSEQADLWLVEADDPTHMKECIDWLSNTALPAVEGRGGDEMTFKTAAMCRSYGMSEDTAMHLMMEYYNPRCQPEWSYDEMEVKVGNAYQYPTSPAGNVTSEGKAKLLGMDKVAPEAREEDDGGRFFESHNFRLVNRQAMNSIEPPEWLIDNLLPDDDMTIMYAPYSSYKTFIALDMALSVATGVPIDPVHSVRKAGPVLFLAGEGRSNLLARTRAWEKVHWMGAQAENFYLGDPAPKITQDYNEMFEQVLKWHPDGVRLVVIDTISRSLQGENENTQETATKFIGMCDDIRKELGCAVLAIHHTGKNDEMRGSSAFGGDVAAIYRCKKATKNVVELKQDKIKDGVEWEHPMLIGLQETDNTLVAVQPTADHKAAAARAGGNTKIAVDILKDMIVETCRNRPGHTFSMNEMAKLLVEHDDVEVGAEALRKRLKQIKDDPGMRVEAYVTDKGFLYEAG